MRAPPQSESACWNRIAHKTGIGGTRNGITRDHSIGIITLPDGRHLAVAAFVSDSAAMMTRGMRALPAWPKPPGHRRPLVRPMRRWPRPWLSTSVRSNWRARASFGNGARLSVPTAAGREAHMADYVASEVFPFIDSVCQTPGIPITTYGASLGAYHAANTLFKHPDHVKRCYALSGVYDDNAVLMPQSEEAVMGKAAIGEYYKKLFANPDFVPFTLKSDWNSFQLAGDIAIAASVFEGDATRKEKQIHFHGKDLLVWKKQSDGSWRIFRNMYDEIPAKK